MPYKGDNSLLVIVYVIDPPLIPKRNLQRQNDVRHHIWFKICRPEHGSKTPTLSQHQVCTCLFVHAKLHSYANSFIPTTIKLWNKLLAGSEIDKELFLNKYNNSVHFEGNIVIYRPRSLSFGPTVSFTPDAKQRMQSLSLKNSLIKCRS